MPAKSTPVALPDPQELFNAALVVQTAKNAQVTCRFWRCITKGRCTGGPRGTCRATGGFPVCSSEGQRRLDMYKSQRKWQAEDGHENDSAGERSGRHMQLISRRLDIEALVVETNRMSRRLNGE